MPEFLYQTAKEIYNNYHNKTNNVCIVFPNKRTGLFFRKYFGEISGKTIWSPDIYTIRSFVQHISRLVIADRTSLLFDLYESFRNVYKKQDNNDFDLPFDRFYHLGEIILRDLDTIDSYLIDPNQIFTNIKDLEEIERRFDYMTEEEKQILRNFWKSFTTEKRSIEKERFVELWAKMPAIRTDFVSGLLKNKIGYEGLVYRQLAKLIDDETLKFKMYEKIIFIGFNVLNKGQEKLFSYLKKENVADFYWDADQYYLTDKKQEAGYFIRNNVKQFTPEQTFDMFPGFFHRKSKNVKTIGAPLEVAQAKLIESILTGYKEKTGDSIENEKTAIILADEHLLFPVLHSLPESIQKINVTMGYPFRATSLYSLLSHYLSLQTSVSQRKTKEIQYYYKDVLVFLRHPEIWPKNKDAAQRAIDAIEKNNMVYIDVRFLLQFENRIFNRLFTPVDNPKSLFYSLLEILFELYVFDKNTEETQTHTLEDEYIYEVYLQIKRLLDVIEQKNIELTIPISVKLLTQLLLTLRIPFSGEPLEGIQIMGLLETRNLDFKNLIVLSVNEGIIPQTSRQPTFLTESLRTAFQLPVTRHQDAIYAYYFYRLMQRAENITLIYNTVTAFNKSGEESRFIKQLRHEAAFDIKECTFNQSLKPASPFTISIEKNDNVIKLLYNYFCYNGKAKQQLTASAINTYINCPLKFYFQYIAKIRETDKVEEEINPLVFGDILHKALELLYQNHIIKKNRKEVIASDFKDITGNIDFFIKEAFKSHFNIAPERKFTFRGNQIIISDVMKRHLQRILHFDEKYTPFEVISLEKKKIYFGTLPVKLFGKEREIGIKGVIDRIDIKNETLRVVDYKTGSIEKTFSHFSELFDPKKANRKKEILQILFYVYLLKQSAQYNANPIIPALFGIRNISDEDFNPMLQLKSGKQKQWLTAPLVNNLMPEFETCIRDVIENIFDKQTPFKQTQKTANCRFCTYNQICGRSF